MGLLKDILGLNKYNELKKDNLTQIAILILEKLGYTRKLKKYLC